MVSLFFMYSMSLVAGICADNTPITQSCSIKNPSSMGATWLPSGNQTSTSMDTSRIISSHTSQTKSALEIPDLWLGELSMVSTPSSLTWQEMPSQGTSQTQCRSGKTAGFCHVSARDQILQVEIPIHFEPWPKLQNYDHQININVGKTMSEPIPNFSIFIGGIVTIRSNGWFIIIFFHIHNFSDNTWVIS